MKKSLWNGVKKMLAAVLAVVMLVTAAYVNEEPEVMPLVDFEEEIHHND